MAMTVQERVARHREKKRAERLAQIQPDWEHVALHLDKMPKRLRDRIKGVIHTRERTVTTNSSDTNEWPPDWKKKLEQRVKRVREQEEMARSDAIQKMLEETILPEYRREHKRYQQFNNAYEGVMSRTEYKKILSCLHPDKAPSEMRLREAFDIMKKGESVLCGLRQNQKSSETLPASVADLMARRKKKP